VTTHDGEMVDRRVRPLPIFDCEALFDSLERLFAGADDEVRHPEIWKLSRW
jgi:hypothetical protein